MTVDGRPLFRPEAVEHHARGRTEQRPLDFGDRRTSWVFRGLVAAVFACVLVGFTVHADVSAKGMGTVGADGHTATLLLPAGAYGRLAAGQRVRLGLPGGDVHATVTSKGRPEARPDGIVVPVVAVLDAPRTAGAQGVAVVRLGHPTLAALLLGRHGG